ncbi:hypothetical protein SLEP1_g8276 [Rubroshorea leprosula]|uniref:ARM repeat N-terminal plant domain-containing protein n=1 Tax=Rubroshorea leprosula TaxID=152421 RepID=A0AAV5I5N9_9ROSI|nr:hypothetical protein SLEP1_g8276 [Rubroshorea leprosula]
MPSKEPPCNKLYCFFCTMKEPEPSLRRAKLAHCFKELPLRDDPEDVLVLSGLWSIAMTQPDDPEFPSLGIFECMTKLIQKGINDQNWLLKDQNIYIPYYAAHIIGSYTMNRADFAERTVKAGAVLALLELLRGKMSWVEQRAAVRALGHVAGHDNTFQAIAAHEAEIVDLAMEISCNCIAEIDKDFVGVKRRKRLKYHRDLLTRGHGGAELENRKAEEWASQLQCWSLYILNCFACKQRSLNKICNKDFLNKLCQIWGGLVNRNSPAGIGLIRTLCETKAGRENIANSKEVLRSLCNVSRSSDDWQFMAIDCLLLLLKDPVVRNQVIDIAALYLVDLVELRSLGGRNRVGEEITQIILKDYHRIKYGNMKLKSRRAEKALEEIWDLKVEKRKREKLMSEEELKQREVLAYDMKGLARESLMDCLMFINGRMRSEKRHLKGVKIPYYAARMINKQMNATWLFGDVQTKNCEISEEGKDKSNGQFQLQEMLLMMKKTDVKNRISPVKGVPAGEGQLVEKRWNRKLERQERRRKGTRPRGATRLANVKMV